MDRRTFLKDTAQVGAGLTVSGGLRESLGSQPRSTNADAGGLADAAALSDQASAGKSLDARVAATPVVSLDEGWVLAVDPENVGRTQQWFAHPAPEAKPTTVPGAIQLVYPGYHGVAWYWREFSPPAHSYKDGRYLLRFWGVDYLADVWVNGKYVGGHEGGETPFVFDVTESITATSANRVAVRVLNPSNVPIDGIVLEETPRQHKRIPYQNGVVYDFGGIMQPVELLLTPSVRVDHVFVRPDSKTGTIRIEASIQNATGRAARRQIEFTLAPALEGETTLVKSLGHEVPAGQSTVNTTLDVAQPHPWSVDDPYLYRITTRVREEGVEGGSELTVRTGFRDFRVVDGYFQLNGRRVFLRSSITLNHCPVGMRQPPPQFPDLLRRDMIYSKASGFNTVRFAVGSAYPYQLDLCDEIGLMAYEETYAADSFKDSPKMKERFDRALSEMILRDRNHPSLVMWELLNETSDGPVFRHAVETLPLIRSLDDTRTVMLSSGRFDGDLSIGSVSNPGSSQWEYTWGREATGASKTPDWKKGGYPSPAGVGAFHYYPPVPPTPESNRMIRTLGDGTKPVFFAEYGTGSLKDVIHEARMYEQIEARPDLEDNQLMHTMAERFIADWNRYGMDGVYPFPEDMLRESQHRMARYRLHGFNLIRSNPQICGFDLTAMLDGAMAGGGVWRFWRDWKPGVMDAMQDGWWPLRWCLFVDPPHGYIGRPVTVEAVLANEGMLAPGDYPVRLRVWGPGGTQWERQATARVPQPTSAAGGPFAIPVLKEEIELKGPTGTYQLVANMERGGAPLGRSWRFFASDAAALPKLELTVTAWGLESKIEDWLKAQGITVDRFGGAAPEKREIILVGDLSKAGAPASSWTDLVRRMARGSVVIFLAPSAFQGENDNVRWLPLSPKGRLYKYREVSIYHKECVAKTHPIFDALQAGGILDWDYYGPLIPHYVFDGQNTPDDTVAAAFGVGQGDAPSGYASGLLMGAYRFGEGRFVVNTLPVLDQVDAHPAADRLLLNMVNYAASFVKSPLAALPSDFEVRLRSIGYPI